MTLNTTLKSMLVASIMLIGSTTQTGPISASIAYWATKSLCYGTAIAGTGVLVVSTGGLAGAATGAIVAASTTTAGAGATVVAGAIAGAGLTTEAAAATTAVVLSGAGGVAQAVTLVEGLSTGVGALFFWLPLP